MAQDEAASSSSDPSISRNVSFSRLNAQAPEFVPSPRSDLQAIPPPPPPPPPALHLYHSPPPFHLPIRPPHVPVLALHRNHPHHLHYYYGGPDQPQPQPQPAKSSSSSSDHSAPSKNKQQLSDESALKLLNQVCLSFHYFLLLLPLLILLFHYFSS